MLAVEWYLQLYMKCKMWRLDLWMYDWFHRLGEKLGAVLGKSRNEEDVFALLKLTSDFALNGFRTPGTTKQRYQNIGSGHRPM